LQTGDRRFYHFIAVICEEVIQYLLAFLGIKIDVRQILFQYESEGLYTPTGIRKALMPYADNPMRLKSFSSTLNASRPSPEGMCAKNFEIIPGYYLINLSSWRTYLRQQITASTHRPMSDDSCNEPMLLDF